MKNRKALGSDEESYDSGSGSDSDSLDEGALKKHAISNIERELMDLNDEDDAYSQNASESDDGNINVNFDEKPQGKQSK